jgi:hypothetical protein
MKYLVLIQHFDPDSWERISEDERGAIAAEFKALAETPGVTRGLPLQPAMSATTVRLQDGKPVTTNGPFVAIEEAVSGYFVFEGEDLDAAIEVATRVPQVRRGLAVEVRPMWEG